MTTTLRSSRQWLLVALFALAASALASRPAQAQAREEARLIVGTQVLEELRAQRDQFVPDFLLDRAYGVAVIPDVNKIGFGVGARRGKGMMVVRDRNGRWSNPLFVTLTGGSIGWQIGVQASDVVLVFTTRKSVEGIADGKFTLGADGSVAAGPVGRQASAATDPTFSSEVYSYSRARGLFAGVALDGSALTIDDRSNRLFYGNRRVSASDIMSGSVTRDSETVRRFLAAIAVSTSPSGRDAATTAVATPVPAAPANAPAAAAPAPAGGEARTFPLEDAQPGAEPKN